MAGRPAVPTLGLCMTRNIHCASTMWCWHGSPINLNTRRTSRARRNRWQCCDPRIQRDIEDFKNKPMKRGFVSHRIGGSSAATPPLQKPKNVHQRYIAAPTRAFELVVKPSRLFSRPGTGAIGDRLKAPVVPSQALEKAGAEFRAAQKLCNVIPGISHVKVVFLRPPRTDTAGSERNGEIR